MINLFVAGAFVAAIIAVAWEGGLFAWVLRGCPDYLDENAALDEAHTIIDAHHNELVDVVTDAWPAGRDLQGGWPS